MKALNSIFIPVLLLVVTATSPCLAVDCNKAIIDAVMADYLLDSEFFEIEVLSNRLKSTDVNPDQLTFVNLTNKEPIGLFNILVTLDADGEVIEKGQVRMRIRKFADVLVSTDRITRHTELSESNVILQRMEITTLRERPIESMSELVEYRAKRNIRKDQVLTMAGIERIPDIDVGRDVTIVIGNDYLEITAPGRSLQAGSAGDYVKVKNTATGKVLKARVVDEASVAVDI